MSDQSELSTLVKEDMLTIIGQQVDLPPGEPTILNVLDADKMAIKHPFFYVSEPGDLALFYEDNFVVLYRPSTERVIQVTER